MSQVTVSLSVTRADGAVASREFRMPDGLPDGNEFYLHLLRLNYTFKNLYFGRREAEA